MFSMDSYQPHKLLPRIKLNVTVLIGFCFWRWLIIGLGKHLRFLLFMRFLSVMKMWNSVTANKLKWNTSVEGHCCRDVRTTFNVKRTPILISNHFFQTTKFLNLNIKSFLLNKNKFLHRNAFHKSLDRNSWFWENILVDMNEIKIHIPNFVDIFWWICMTKYKFPILWKFFGGYEWN